MSNFNRQYELKIGGSSTGQILEAAADREHSLRVTFDVTHEWGGNRSLADIAIYGFSRATEGKIFKEYDNIELNAGYIGSLGCIFKGDVKNVVKERRGADRITRIYALSDAFTRRKAVINKTAGPGSTIVKIIRMCAEAIGLPAVINAPDFSDDPAYSRGKPLNGDPVMILRRLSKTHKFEFTIESGRILIVKSGKYRAGSPIVIGQETVMIGTPELTMKGVNASINLSPTIRLGSRFEIDVRTPKVLLSSIIYQNIESSIDVGIYTVAEINHRGDSHSDTWETRLKGWRFAA